MDHPSQHSLPEITIIVPVFNERATIVQVVKRLRAALAGRKFEILIIDDGSTDGTADELRVLAPWPEVRLFHHPQNQGKGSALRTGFAQARGETVVVQDADLEYDPREICGLVRPILEDRADVVYGNRFQGKDSFLGHFHGLQPRSCRFMPYVANRVLTFLSNRLTGLGLSDMETGHKAFRIEVARKLTIRENRFGVEPELTAKVARMGCRVIEVPVAYQGRSRAAGKKIGPRDAMRAAWCILRYRLAD